MRYKILKKNEICSFLRKSDLYKSTFTSINSHNCDSLFGFSTDESGSDSEDSIVDLDKFDNKVEDVIKVPMNCYPKKLDKKSNIIIENNKDFVNILDTMRFWMVVHAPFEVFEYLESMINSAINNEKIDILIKKYSDLPFIEEIEVLYYSNICVSSSANTKTKKNPTNLVYTCVRKGYINLIKYIQHKFNNNGFKWNSSASYWAAQAGNMKSLKYIIETGGKYDVITLSCAAENNHLHIVKYLINLGCKVNFDIIKYVIKNDNVECLEFIFKEYENVVASDKLLANYAFKSKSLKSLRFLVDSGLELILSIPDYKSLILDQNIDVLKYILDVAPPEQYLFKAMIVFCISYKMDMKPQIVKICINKYIIYCRQNSLKTLLDNSLIELAHNNENTYLLPFLHKRGFKVDPKFLTKIVICDDSESLIYFHNNGYSLTKSMWHAAFNKGSTKVLKYLENEGIEILFTKKRYIHMLKSMLPKGYLSDKTYMSQYYTKYDHIHLKNLKIIKSFCYLKTKNPKRYQWIKTDFGYDKNGRPRIIMSQWFSSYYTDPYIFIKQEYLRLTEKKDNDIDVLLKN